METFIDSHDFAPVSAMPPLISRRSPRRTTSSSAIRRVPRVITRRSRKASRRCATCRDVGQPDVQYGVTPVALMKFAAFMARIGTLKEAPNSWKDVFFPEAYNLEGS